MQTTRFSHFSKLLLDQTQPLMSVTLLPLNGESYRFKESVRRHGKKVKITPKGGKIESKTDEKPEE